MSPKTSAPSTFFKSIAVFLALLLPLLLHINASQAATSIPFTVAMSEAVNVTGTPRIVLDVDGNTRYATYSAGTGIASLTFTYTATAGDVDLNGIGLASSSVDLNGGTITDLNGNALTNLTFTPPANMASVFINYPSLSMDFIADVDGRYSLNGTAYNDLTSFLTAAGGTFARASTATYYNSAGTLQTAASGTPRFDYDPSTLAAKGILIEESRTNSVLYSDQFDNPMWIKGGTSITANTATSPAGTTSADLLTNTSTSNAYVREGTFPLTGAAYYSITAFVKAGSNNYVFIQLSDWTANAAGASFDISTGSVGNSITAGDGTAVSKTITAIGNGWYRVNATVSFASNRNVYVAIWAPSTLAAATTSTIGNTISIWGAQLEQGAFATSYIPTTSTTVTRSNDDLYIPAASWFNASHGSLLGIGISRTAGTGAQMLTAIGTDTLDLIAIRQRSIPDVFFMGREGGTNFDGGGYPGISLNVLNKIGIAYADSTLGVLSLNGAAPQNAGTYLGTYGTSYARLTVGSFPSTGGYWNGTIQKVKYYPSRVSNTQLQLLTQ